MAKIDKKVENFLFFAQAFLAKFFAVNTELCGTAAALKYSSLLNSFGVFAGEFSSRKRAFLVILRFFGISWPF